MFENYKKDIDLFAFTLLLLVRLVGLRMTPQHVLIGIAVLLLMPWVRGDDAVAGNSSNAVRSFEKHLLMTCIPNVSFKQANKDDVCVYLHGTQPIDCVPANDDMVDFYGNPVVKELEAQPHSDATNSSDQKCLWRSLEVRLPSSLSPSTSTTPSTHSNSSGSMNVELLRHAFDLADRQADVRRLYVVYSRHDHHRVQGMLEKEFLHHMTWWRVVRESYLQYRVTAPSIVSQPHNTSTSSAANKQTKRQRKLSSTSPQLSTHSTEHIMEVLLEKVTPSIKPMLQMVSSAYYPSEATCRKSLMIIFPSLFLHPGLAGEAWMTIYLSYTKHFAVLLEYLSVSNNATDSAAFITGSDCPDTLNKWECAFFPTTNCTVPKQITECRTKQCVSNIERVAYNAAIATSATADGQLFTAKDEEKVKALLEKDSVNPHDPVQSKYNELFVESSRKYLTRYRISFRHRKLYFDPITKELHPPKLTDEEINMDSSLPHEEKHLTPCPNNDLQRVYLQNYLFRYNHFYRNMIQATLLNFTRTFQVNFFAAYDLQLYPHSHEKSKHHKESKEAAATTATGAATGGGESISSSIYEEVSGYVRKSCVAAHIRRGDRTVPNVNMTKYCEENPNDSDKGCHGIPLGIVTLKSVLKHAESLVNSSEVNSLIVTTDDFAWFEKEKDALEEEQKNGRVAIGLQGRWNVYTLQPLLKQYQVSDRVPMTVSRGGTANGILFHASMELLSQCEAFIGHFASSVTKFIFDYMCNRHGNYRNLCPPFYDMRWGLNRQL